MSAWLDGLGRALDAARVPAVFFFRDDDGGWSDERLFALLDLFARHAMPVDLAVIPDALTPRPASELRARVKAAPEGLAIHQHGRAHLNHETEGRKCEFGVARDHARQLRDIEAGQARLARLFGQIVSPIFTPPWNRCTAVTGDCLRRAGFRVLSRDPTATPLNVEGLFELPVTVDWFARRKGVRLSLEELGASLVAAVEASLLSSAPVGVMFHHAPMDAGERRRAGELLALLAAHPNARACLMDELVTELGYDTALSTAARTGARRPLAGTLPSPAGGK
jgi:peptidoglycan/xylan/chitin deacetylase (PgdA/CDA1 family)